MKLSLRIALNTQHPVFIFWGPELFCFYNDAYSRSIGADRHPSIIGKPGREVWEEIWDIIGPQIAQVMRGGEATWHVNQLVPITRNGLREDVWWTYSYSPIDDPAAPCGVGGILVLCNETTDQVLGRRQEANEAQRLREMFEQAPGFMCLLNGPEHRFIFANAAYRRLIGGREVRGKTVREALPEISGQGFYELLDEVYRTGQRYVATRARVTLRPSSEDGGGERFLDFVYEPVRDEDGAITGVFVEGHDVTESVCAAQSAEARLAELESLYAAAPTGLALFNRDFQAVRMNNALAEMNGFTVEQHLGRTIWDLVPDLRSSAEPLLKRALAGETLTNVEVTGETPSQPGVTRHWVEQFYPVRNKQGEVVGVGVVCEEVTERKRGEMQLRASETRLGAALAIAGLGTWEADLAEPRKIWDGKLAALAGIAPMGDPAAPEDWMENIHADDKARVTAALVHAATTGGQYAEEFRIRRKDTGAERIFLSRGQRVSPNRMVGVVQDVTEARAVETELRDLNATLEARVSEASEGQKLWGDIIEANDAFIQAIDPQYRLIAINRANITEYEKRFGKTPRVGDSLVQTLAEWPDQFERAKAIWTRALEGESIVVTERYGDPGVGQRWYEMKFSPLLRRDGTTMGALHISYDVSDRVWQQEQLAQAQAQLFEAQKMETIGQLTGGVAHDFNNLLSAVLSNLDLARKHVTDGRVQKLLEGAVKGAERGAALTSRLLAFARRQDLEVSAIRLQGLFADMSDLLGRSLGPSIRIATELPRDLPPVRVDRNQLELAVLNVALNARDAMPTGGTLSVSAREETVAKDLGDLRAGRYVRLAISDTGVGMDDETLRKAADPFFTTKGVGKGTGLGLSMVQGLAAQSGGTLRLSTTLGVGTTVELWLPQSAEGELESEAPQAPTRATSSFRKRKILVVDDDTLVSMGTVAMLEDLGHAVLEASSGAKALDVLAQHPDVELVLTDQAMPGMNGTELVRRLRVRRPDIAIVLATGYAELVGEDDLGLPRLSKPFRQTDLEDMIARLFDAGKSPAPAGGKP